MFFNIFDIIFGYHLQKWKDILNYQIIKNEIELLKTVKQILHLHTFQQFAS
jgi:hypothetical protein